MFLVSLRSKIVNQQNSLSPIVHWKFEVQATACDAETNALPATAAAATTIAFKAEQRATAAP
jgi:hypothetical protein